MRAIWKVQLKADIGRQAIKMPRGAKILSVQDQCGNLCLWAEVDTEEPAETRNIRIYGTGHEVRTRYTSRLEYIATIQLFGGSFVLHIYEIIGKMAA